MAEPIRFPTNETAEEKRRRLLLAQRVEEPAALRSGSSGIYADVEQENVMDAAAAAERAATQPTQPAQREDPFARERAAQNVMFQRQHGSGLDTLAAMQDPNYEIGTGGALQQAPRQIGTKSGAMRREARRLRKQGYTAQAGQLAGAAARQKLMEGSAIKKESARGVEAAQQIQTGEMAMQQQDLLRQQAQLAQKLISKRSADIDKGGDAPMDFSEPVRYRDRDYSDFRRRLLDGGADSPYFGGRNRYFNFE